MSKVMHMTAFILVVIGALNWGLVGLFSFNLVELILGSVTWLERLVYVLVGISGVWLAATHRQNCGLCSVPAPHPAAPATVASPKP